MRARSGLRNGRSAALDALRGIAALGVVLFHVSYSDAFVGTARTPEWLGRGIALVNSFGFAGVYLFFVISGFCIHMRWAKARLEEPDPKVDFWEFWKHRLRRLYPTYLVALIAYLGLLHLQGDLPVNRFLVYNVGMHLSMLHNLDGRTTHSLCGVFWTLAVEEQLYLAYFLLLRFRNRLGWKLTLAICFGFRVLSFLVFLALNRVFGLWTPVTEAAASLWCIWVLGSISVEAALGIIRLPAWCSDLRLGAGVLLAAAVLHRVHGTLDPHSLAWKLLLFLLDPLWGLGFFFLVNRAIAAEGRWNAAGRAPRAVSALAAVGLCSYSLYLTHQMILLHASRSIGWSKQPQLLLLLAPACVLFAWLFFQVFEKPFLTRGRAPRGMGWRTPIHPLSHCPAPSLSCSSTRPEP